MTNDELVYLEELPYNEKRDKAIQELKIAYNKKKFAKTWSAGEVLTVRYAMKMQTYHGNGTGHFKIGDDVIYRGCRYYEGKLMRIFATVATGGLYWIEDRRGYLRGNFRN